MVEACVLVSGSVLPYANSHTLPPMLAQATDAFLFAFLGVSQLWIIVYQVPVHGPLFAKQNVKRMWMLFIVGGYIAHSAQLLACISTQDATTQALCNANHRLNSCSGFLWIWWFVVLLLIQNLWPRWVMTWTFITSGAGLFTGGLFLALSGNMGLAGSLALMVWGFTVLAGWVCMFWSFKRAARLASQLEHKDLPEYTKAWVEAVGVGGGEEAGKEGLGQGSRARVAPEDLAEQGRRTSGRQRGWFC